ncbi:MYXO-CTERM sorting domain-containing protein [Nannocystis radixulma]|uniref:MYXO-CTERM sorting domain-containing protein n=1 Tax=Nannocystis radixulma TaxID=2995305 RepID=A0ABT5BDB2_9BACT|nr:MYXO-CTERM sorting domain-containing protein [Nannocystis radixulma]MDC0672042.1 MYXO-CTERM sorting domain-containing protein [Nannocystis radixulma]
MRLAHGIATITAATILAVSATASAVQTPTALARRPHMEVARGAPVRVAGELAWHQVPAKHRRAWSRVVAEMGPQTWAVWDRDTDVVRRIWGAGIAAPGSANSPEAAERLARAFLSRHVALLAPGAAAADFTLVANVESGGMRTLGFTQSVRGVAVAGGQLSFRFKNDRLFMIASEALPHVPAPAVRSVSASEARRAAIAWLERDLSPGTVTFESAHEAAVLPLVRASKVEYATVVPVEVSTLAPRGRWRVYVDAVTGEPVARTQELRFAGGKVAYDAPLRDPGGERLDFPANRASLTVAGMPVTSSEAGDVMWAGNAATMVTTRATGTQVAVDNDAGGEATANLNLQPNQTAVWSGANDQFIDAQITTFVHTNAVIEYVRQIDPDLDWLGTQVDAIVNINDSCNAYYDGNLNFFSASNQCNNTGRVADIVYHEFGHGVHDHSLIQGVGNFEPALSEGVSDYLAATIVDDPAMGIGFFLDDPGPLRHIDPMNSEAVWPDDIDGDTHITGLIIAGALWDLRKALVEDQGPAGVAVADHLYYEATRRAVDIPSMYFEALAADDDDGDLANGTPHQCMINSAFARHGLFKLGVDVEAPGVALPQLAEYQVSVAVEGGGGQCEGGAIESAELTWRLREQQNTGGVIAMDIAPDVLTGAIPQQPAGSVVQYQVKITFADQTVVQYPENVADPFYEFFVGAVENIYCTDFEADPAADGWTHGLTSGQQGEGADDWMWAEPLAPASSGDPGAAFDGSRVFGNDLGGGDYNGTYQSDKVNYAQTPAIDTTGYSQVRLQYRRWLNIEDGQFDRATIYANDQPLWENFVSPDMNNASTHHTDREWRFHDVDLTAAVMNDSVTVKYELQSDQGLEMGGWTLDAFCVVGVVDAPAAVCGDGIVSVGEACDDGEDNSDTTPDACRTDCTAASCGDGVVDGGEECDDGNNADGDGCEATCVPGSPTSTSGDSDSDGSSGQVPTTDGPSETGDEPTTSAGPDSDTEGETDATDGETDTDSDSGGGATDESGCGCRQDGPGGAGLSALTLLLLALRRRRPGR